MPNTLAKFQEMKYNESRRFDLLRQYKQSAEKERVTNVGFDEFEKVLKEANKKIIGIKTSTGAIVEGISYHLIERIIGNEKENRAGVPIENIVETLETGTCDGVIKYSANNKPSIKFKSKKAIVTFNPKDKIVVQCIPKTRGQK